jgi:hypothetical protein
MAGKQIERIRLRKFAEKHSHEPLFYAEPITLSDLIAGRVPWETPTIEISRLKKELRQWSPIRTLEAAAKENCPEAFNLALRVFLLKMEIEPPKNVLTPLANTHGEQHLRIYDALQQIEADRPRSISQICEWLDRRCVPLPKTRHFDRYKSWTEALKRMPGYTRKWISEARKKLYLAPLPRGPE